VGNGTLDGYAFDGLFMSDKSYPFTLFANRAQNTLAQGFGGQSDVTFESRGGVFELRENSFLQDYGFLNFTSVLDAHQEVLKEDSSVFGSPFLRDETRNIVRYHAQKGGETSDLDLRYELNDVSDPLNPTDVFDSNTVRVFHSLDFGPTLNRRVDSIFYYFDRTGSGSGSFLSADEILHLDHSSDLATDYRYGFSQSSSDAGVTTANVASIGLLYQFYRQLTTAATGRATRQDFPTGNVTMYGGQTNADYRHPLAWGGQFFLDTSGGYQVDENHFSSSTLDVIDEPHTAPPVLGVGAGFTLNNSFVVTDTIVMVDVRGGSRLPTTLGVDYDISPEGSLTKIIPLPSSPVIRPGDPLEVSYTYEVAPDLKYSTATVTGRLGVDFPLVVASYEHALSDQARLAGTAPPQFLINQNVDRFELELRNNWDNVRAHAIAAYEIQNSTIVDFNAWRFNQLVSYQPRSDLVAQISGNEYFVDYPGQGRHSSSYLVRGNVDWFTSAGFSISTFAGYRQFHDTSIRSDEIIDSGVRVRWTYHDLEVAPSFTWTDYLTRLTDMRGELRVTRHWF
jgi:hypothetical protein